MKLKSIYQEAIKKGIEGDIRSKKEIDEILKKEKDCFDKLDKKGKDLFDKDRLFNPFADTRILNGDPEANIKSVMVGVDMEGPELLLADRLTEKGQNIDLVIAHHPEGHAFAKFYEVMDLQVNIFAKQGIAISTSENLLNERKSQVARRVSAANHTRSVDIARLLGINFMCMHTVCDNWAYQYMEKSIDRAKPKTLGSLMKVIADIPEYVDAAKHNNPPQLVVGSKGGRCNNIYLEFTGGTEGPKGIYKELSAKGIDTIVAMHQSEEHYKTCKENNINVIFASHIASDNLGINIVLDHLEKKEKLKVFECSGFKRIRRPKK